MLRFDTGFIADRRKMIFPNLISKFIGARNGLVRSIRIWPAAILLMVSGFGCGSANQNSARRYNLTGRVVSTDPVNRSVVVDGDEVPGYMAPMAMPYRVRNVSALQSIRAGDQIKAEIVVTDQGAYLENISVTKPAEGSKPPPGSSQRLPQPGDQVPNFAFVNQDGQTTALQDFRGKSVLLTFIYTRCPLPDYCPLMTENFEKIESQLVRSGAAYQATHLLSISFDPKYDTPHILRDYGSPFLRFAGEREFAHWEFASAPADRIKEIAEFFGLFVQEREGQIVHSMSTAIIDPAGKLSHWYHGNDWKTEEVLQDLLDSLPQNLVSARTK